MVRKASQFLLFALLGCLSLTTAQSQDTDQDSQDNAEAESTEALISKGQDYFTTCSGCHAIPSMRNTYPTYHVPRLGGQHPQYIVDALTAYANKERDHPTMIANAVSLDDEMKQAIGEFLYTAQKSSDNDDYVTGDPEAGEALATEYGCATCHGSKGMATEGGNFPALAGQYEDYLHRSLKQYISGVRDNAVMRGSVAEIIEDDLSDEDLLNIAAFYASQEDGLTTVEFDQ